MLHRFQSAEAIAQQAAAGTVYILITSGALPAGYLAYEKRGDELFLSKIYLLKEYRGLGLGRAAMAFIKRKARELGCTRIALTVNKNNSRSIDAYLRMGFMKDRPMVMDIGGGFVMDDYRMVMEISPSE
jgi:GNAT superfamily N-acetyltransferase